LRAARPQENVCIAAEISSLSQRPARSAERKRTIDNAVKLLLSEGVTFKRIDVK
jgi:hypothetical protein